MNLADLRELGKTYTVHDLSGKKLKEFRLVYMDEILSSAAGEYTSDFPSIEEYMDASVAMLTGFTVDLGDISWVIIKDDSFDISELAKRALQEQTSVVIVEFKDS